MGIKPSDEQMDEIMDLAISLNANLDEVSKLITEMINGPTKEECEAAKIEADKRKKEAEKKKKDAADRKRKEEEKKEAIKRETEARRKREERERLIKEKAKKKRIAFVALAGISLIIIVVLCRSFFNHVSSANSDYVADTNEIIDNRYFLIEGQSDYTISFPAEGGKEILRYEKSVSKWDTYYSQPAFVKISYLSSNSIEITCDGNNTNTERTTEIEIKSNDNNETLSILRIKQSGNHN